MYNDSIQFDELLHTRNNVLSMCEERQRSLDKKPVFGLQTALQLLMVECPNQFTTVLLTRVVNMRQRCAQLKDLHTILWSGLLEICEIGNGVWCTTAECTWSMLGRVLDEEELLVVGESMMRRQADCNRTNKEQLEEYVMKAKRYSAQNGVRTSRGIAKCQKILPLMQEHTDSSQESRLRLLLLKNGFGNPEVNYQICNRNTGRMLFLDLAFPEIKVAIEYDGAHHAHQWKQDVRRRHDIEDMGWIYIQVTGDDMKTPAAQEALIRRISHSVNQQVGGTFRPKKMTMRELTDKRRSLVSLF